MNLTDHLLRAASSRDRRAAAETMIPLIGELYRRRDVVTVFPRPQPRILEEMAGGHLPASPLPHHHVTATPAPIPV